MSDADFVDFYELLEVSRNANSETIEKVFRHLAHRYHPDVAGTGDKARFQKMVDAYKTLANAESRADYDVQLNQQLQDRAKLHEGAAAVDHDCGDRHRMLQIFYAQRRRDMKNPGVGEMALEQVLGCPMEVLEFHLWFLREKQWVRREENGLLSITAEGVDEIESRCHPWASKDRRITDQSRSTPPKSSSTADSPWDSIELVHQAESSA